MDAQVGALTNQALTRTTQVMMPQLIGSQISKPAAAGHAAKLSHPPARSDAWAQMLAAIFSFAARARGKREGFVSGCA